MASPVAVILDTPQRRLDFESEHQPIGISSKE
jgi:hypothetical protein